MTHCWLLVFACELALPEGRPAMLSSSSGSIVARMNSAVYEAVSSRATTNGLRDDDGLSLFKWVKK